jgi:hypothetical protein
VPRHKNEHLTQKLNRCTHWNRLQRKFCRTSANGTTGLGTALSIYDRERGHDPGYGNVKGRPILKLAVSKKVAKRFLMP